MTKRVLAVGGAPSFATTVASMLAGAESVQWIANVPEVEVSLPPADDPPYAIVLAPEVAEYDAIALGRQISSSAPTTAVVVLREGLHNGFVPAAMKAGIRDVIDLSADDPSDELARAMAWAESIRQPRSTAKEPTGRGRVITVFSSKGGSGKSFLSSNLAAAIAARWEVDTALVDVDLAMGDAMAYFGQQDGRLHRSQLDLTGMPEVEALKMKSAKLHEHLFAFAAPPDPTGDDGVSAETIRSLLESIASTFPYVVVDVPGNYHDLVLGALDASDEVILIASLDVVGIRHLARAVDTLRSIGVAKNRMRVVLNRADSKVGISPSDVEQVLNLHITHMIPSSRLVPASLNEGIPLVLAQPKSDVAKSITDLAEKLIGSPEKKSNHHHHRRRRFAGR